MKGRSSKHLPGDVSGLCAKPGKDLAAWHMCCGVQGTAHIVCGTKAKVIQKQRALPGSPCLGRIGRWRPGGAAEGTTALCTAVLGVEPAAAPCGLWRIRWRADSVHHRIVAPGMPMSHVDMRTQRVGPHLGVQGGEDGVHEGLFQEVLGGGELHDVDEGTYSPDIRFHAPVSM